LSQIKKLNPQFGPQKKQLLNMQLNINNLKYILISMPMHLKKDVLYLEMHCQTTISKLII